MTIETLLPHREPMLFLEALTGYTDKTATATARFDAGHFAVADGKVLEPALVECMAQTVAAAMGSRARGQGGAPRLGMLTIASDFQIFSRPAAGQQLQIETRELRRLGPMLMVAGTITCDGQLVASGNLTLYV